MLQLGGAPSPGSAGAPRSRLATTASDAPCSYRARPGQPIRRSSCGPRAASEPARSRWWMTVVRWTSYRRASPSIEAPSVALDQLCRSRLATAVVAQGLKAVPFPPAPPLRDETGSPFRAFAGVFRERLDARDPCPVRVSMASSGFESRPQRSTGKPQECLRLRRSLGARRPRPNAPAPIRHESAERHHLASSSRAAIAAARSALRALRPTVASWLRRCR